MTIGSNIFCTTLEQVAYQGIHIGQVEKQLVDAWNWTICFKCTVYPASFQVLQKGFNIAWIAGGPPLLDAFVLGQEVSRNLGLLLNQLWAPESSALPDLAAIVLVNSLAGIAKRKPPIFGQILPVFAKLNGRYK